MINLTQTNERNIKDKKFHFWQYFKQHFGVVSLMLFFEILLLISSIFETIFFANIIQSVTEKAYYLAMRQMLIYGVETAARVVLNYIYNVVWYKFQVLVAKEMSFDIIRQSFEVSSKAYTSHSSANFTKRIDSDPFTIFNSLSNLVSTIAMVVDGLIVIGYICFISWQVGLFLILTILICGYIETYRKRKVKAKRKEQYKREASGMLNL